MFAPLAARHHKTPSPKGAAKKTVPKAALGKDIGAPGTSSPLGIAPPTVVQTKLAVSEPGDELEKEADAVADRVMRAPSLVQTGGANGGAPVSAGSAVFDTVFRECDECTEEESESIQREALTVQRACSACGDEDVQRQANDGSAPVADTSFADGLRVARRSGGEPLGTDLRRFMEPRFGTDFGGVRLHRDRQASMLARSIDARAFTVGRDVFFGSAQYRPSTEPGRRLIAHELTHVVQQGGARAGRVQRQEAEAVSGGGASTALAHDIVSGRLRDSGALVARLVGLSSDHLKELLLQIDFEDSQRVSSDSDVDALIASAKDEIRSVLAGRTVVPKPLPPCNQSFAPPSASEFASNGELGRVRMKQLVLRPGASSEGTALVQAALHAFGCDRLNKDLLPRFGADGGYGNETVRAVRAFQKASGVGVDGTVGADTIGALDAFVGANSSEGEEQSLVSTDTFIPKTRIQERLAPDDRAALQAYFALFAEGRIAATEAAEIDALILSIGARTEAAAAGEALSAVVEASFAQSGLAFADAGVLLADDAVGLVIDDVAIPPLLIYGIGAAIVGSIAYVLYLHEKPTQEALDRASKEADRLVKDLVDKAKKATEKAEPKPGPGPTPKPDQTIDIFPPTPDCIPRPVCPHLGGDDLHDFCADDIIQNVNKGCDTNVLGRNFDALDASNTLWEVKTGNWSAQNPFIRNKDLTNFILTARGDMAVAASCGFGYSMLVGDAALGDELRARVPGLNVVTEPGCRQP